MIAEPGPPSHSAGLGDTVTATLLTDAERERGLQRFLASMYPSYRTRTDRELQVFALSQR
ncbi:MAG: hypothetical protein H6522_12220 [Mycolicibacterium sp.]|nr:hypothetical protein [Mycolicibacterium sp.]